MAADFWDNLGRKVTNAADAVGKKTEEVVEITRLKNQQYSTEREINAGYEKIGRIVYEQYKELGAADENISAACDAVKALEEKLFDILQEIEESKR